MSRKESDARYYLQNSERHKQYMKEWRKRNPDSILRQNLKRYDITLEEFRVQEREQDGKCAICGDLPPAGQRLSVDHCHRTNKRRALLCQPCNQALGLLKEDPVRFQKAIEYIRRFQ